ncbi:hypothetical protein [Brevundimonas goettingensis]|uniref:Beta/Gamma crystallin n=1 Tax=Brevundimonas goettingensis TaxID=2774190 RepID=A0A975GUD3_9CAUL|nr:hypothetical protein [Brevundimonas goettingensis]QTC89786.1 hypothetical protein IFJ75_10730 [Brevundimonas goettingensis]
MSRIAITAALIAASVFAGAATAQSSNAIDPTATSFTGWVKVTGGEFELYSEQRSLALPFSRPCVSGALPRDLQRSSADISGQKVTFTGKAVAWADRDSPTSLGYEGSRITNECRGDYVIAADSVRVLRGG